VWYGPELRGQVACRIDGTVSTTLGTLAACGAQRPTPDALATLFQQDQLRTLMAPSCAEVHPLQAFEEACGRGGAPAFPPTYKFITGSQQYDNRRMPSWTDRILCRCNYRLLPDASADAGSLRAGAPNVAPLQTHRYSSVPSLMHSDHRPVVALVSVQLKHTAPVLSDTLAAADGGEAAPFEGKQGKSRSLATWLGDAVTRPLTLTRRRSLEALDQPLRCNAHALACHL
jgi:hypothetical protein